jgi:hypothetical protein
MEGLRPAHAEHGAGDEADRRDLQAEVDHRMEDGHGGDGKAAAGRIGSVVAA